MCVCLALLREDDGGVLAGNKIRGSLGLAASDDNSHCC